MTTRRLMTVLLVRCLAVAGLAAAPAHAATHPVVEVWNNEFRPKTVRIDPGDTVEWMAVQGPHTITEDVEPELRRFDFPVEAGQRRSWTAGATEEHIRYFCTRHPGMTGLITVGNPPGAPVPPTPEVVVPDDVPTIDDAAQGAQPGSVVLVRPGVYRESVTVTRADLTIRGLGESPGAVRLDGGHGRDIGVTVTAPGVRLENLTVANHRHTGIRVHNTAGTVLDQVHTHTNDLYGVDARGSSGVTLRRVTATGHAIAGVAVRDCPTCGLGVEHTTLERNAAGLLAIHATGLLVRHSTVTGNGVGIVLSDSAAATVTANTIAGNQATDVPTASVFTTTSTPWWTGAGIWISGGRAHRIHHNTVTGHTYNIAVTGPLPALQTQVRHNAVDDAIHADLGLDNTGTGVCLTNNARPDGTEPTSDPPAAQTLYDCALPSTVGLPYPVVTARLTAHAAAQGMP